jgi:hypothetical protein
MIKNLRKKIYSLLLITLISFSNLFAQWANDPASNTRLVKDTNDPINVSAICDLAGGGYVFWQDKSNTRKSNIYFLHFDQNGNPSFRSDGKEVAENSDVKENPLAVIDNDGNSIVVWKQIDKKKTSEIFIQKLTKNGLRLWGANGLKLTDTKTAKVDYSITVDDKGFSFVTYITKTNQLPNNYSVFLKKIDSNGRIINDSSKIVVYSANNNISETKVIPDNNRGVFIFWLESVNQKTLLKSQYIDSVGLNGWGNKPITVSKTNNSIISYSVNKTGKNIYTAFTYQGKKKTIYQQLISEKGNLVWGSDGKPISYQPGNQTNPQFVVIDSTVVVSWTNEFDKTKDVMIQRFDIDGKPLWGINGKKVINIKGKQFGQKIVYNNKGGVIIAWIDKKDSEPFADISIQKIDLNGNFIWAADGVTISSSKKMQKSYLNIISDNEGGAIAVFRGKVNGKIDIYGQKIFSTGTYASQILGFTTVVTNDSVKISWYAANEVPGTEYLIQRAPFTDNTEESFWKTIDTLQIANKKEANYYEYYDLPDTNGSIYYRVVQEDNSKKIQITQNSMVDYFHNVESVILGQNSPNPFSDSTTITFYLPQEEKITLEIFNTSIETIKKVEDQEYPAGKNIYVFQASGLAPGIYFYRLKAGSFVDVKKMVLAN